MTEIWTSCAFARQSLFHCRRTRCEDDDEEWTKRETRRNEWWWTEECMDDWRRGDEELMIEGMITMNMLYTSQWPLQSGLRGRSDATRMKWERMRWYDGWNGNGQDVMNARIIWWSLCFQKPISVPLRPEMRMLLRKWHNDNIRVQRDEQQCRNKMNGINHHRKEREGTKRWKAWNERDVQKQWRGGKTMTTETNEMESRN